MAFYTGQHKHYCGVDLHTRRMYVCVLHQDGSTLLHRNLDAAPEPFLEAVEPFRDDLVVCCECTYSWYWLADLCMDEDIPFVLGHAHGMRLVHGSKVSDDAKDSFRVAKLLRAQMIPMAYVYPREMRPMRDLMRRRMKIVGQRTAALAHIHTVAGQYNHPPFRARISQASNREGLWEDFDDPAVKTSIFIDCHFAAVYDDAVRELEALIEQHAKVQDQQTLFLLRSVPGIGKVLGLTLLYEIHDIGRFPNVGNFASYSRLVRCRHTSDDKVKGAGQPKAGNVYLKWAFSEAAVLITRFSPRAKKLRDRLVRRHGRPKALSVLAHKIGRAVYFMLERREPFDPELFYRDAA